MIEQHNAEYAKGIHTFQVADNELTDLVRHIAKCQAQVQVKTGYICFVDIFL